MDILLPSGQVSQFGKVSDCLVGITAVTYASKMFGQLINVCRKFVSELKMLESAQNFSIFSRSIFNKSPLIIIYYPSEISSKAF